MIDRAGRIGYGLYFPLKRQHDDFESGTGRRLLEGCVRKVVNTTASGFGGKIQGTYPWRMNFGSWVSFLRHSNIRRGYQEDLATVYAIEAIALWEPRVEANVDRSGRISDGDQRQLKIRIYFGISERLGGAVETGSYEETYEEVVV